MRKKVLSWLLLTALLIPMLGAAALPFAAAEATDDPYTNVKPITDLTADGTVSAGDVYSISTAAELLHFMNLANGTGKHTFSGATVILTADIDLNPGWTAGEEAPEQTWTPIACFSGTFDGQGHVLRGIRAGETQAPAGTNSEATTGLFASISGSVTLKNFRLENSYFTSSRNASALVGLPAADADVTRRTVVFSGITVDAQVVSTGSYAGGFIAQVFGPFGADHTVTFEACRFSGSVSAAEHAGGFVGLSYRYLTFRDCVSDGSVSGGNCIAGFVAKYPSYGWFGLTFDRCISYASLSLTGTRTTSTFAAGFVGENGASAIYFNDCLSAADFGTTDQPYVTAGFIGQQLDFSASFVRCINLSQAQNPTWYFNQAFIGKINAKTGNDDNRKLELVDCFALANRWKDSANRESRAVGMYIPSKTATEWILAVRYTAVSVSGSEPGESETSQKGQLLDDWAYTLNFNKAYLAGSVTDRLLGSAAKQLLAAYDFNGVWTLDRLTGRPVPAKAAALARGEIYTGARSVMTLNDTTPAMAGGVYTVSNAKELLYFGTVVNAKNNFFAGATVTLTADIDLNPGWEASSDAPVNVWTPIADFQGTFDGQGHTVYGIWAGEVQALANSNMEATTGFFASTKGSVTVKNVTFANSYFTASRNAAAVIGLPSAKDASRTLTFENVVVDAIVESAGAYCGGFVGQMFGPSGWDNTIRFNSCEFRGTLTAGEKSGGFVGLSYRYMTFNDCVFSGTLKVGKTAGGFIGFYSQYAWFGSYFNRCASVGAVRITGTRNTGVFASGYIGECETPAYFTDCLSAVDFGESDKPYVTAGFIGHQTHFEASFVRCISLVKAQNPTQYYNASMIGKIDAKTGNSGSQKLYFEDCFTEENQWQENGGDRVSRAVGMYIGTNTATEWMIEVKYTVRTAGAENAVDTVYDQKGKMINDWQYLYDFNADWLAHAVAGRDALLGAEGRTVLAAYDCAAVWSNEESGRPIPMLAEVILRGEQKNPAAMTEIDATFTSGTADRATMTLTDSVTEPTYTFSIETQYRNSMKIFADRELTKELKNPVTLRVNGENLYYVQISSRDGSRKEVWTAKITTTGADLMSYDLETEVRFFGRTYLYNGAYYMNWTASGFEVSFKGTGLSAVMLSDASNADYYAYIKVTLDGRAVRKIPLANTLQTVDLVKGLENTTHTVRVEMVSGNGKCATAALRNLKLHDGEKQEPPAAPEGLRMEIIGDSISVGYGVLGKQGDAWRSATEDGTLTYAALAARALGMEYHVTASSGKGIARNYGGSTTNRIPDIYTETDGYHLGKTAWDFAGWQPDAVVINLGTNDADSTNASLTAEAFSTACAAFLRTVREKNPNAYIIYAYGMMNTRFSAEIEAVVKAMQDAGDAKILYLPMEKITDAEKTVSSHPSLEAHMRRAEVLIAKLKELFGDRVSEQKSIADMVANDRNLPLEKSLTPGGEQAPIKTPDTFDPGIIIPGGKDPETPTEELPTGQIPDTTPETPTGTASGETETDDAPTALSCRSVTGAAGCAALFGVAALAGMACKWLGKNRRRPE